MDHLRDGRMGPLSIICCVGEDHRQVESSCDVGGPKYPWSVVDGKMQSSRVGLSPRCHRVITLDDYPRIKISTQRHEQLQAVSLHKEHGVLELRVLGKCREIVVNLPVQISLTAVSITLDGVAVEVGPPGNGCRGKVRGSSNALIRQ